MSTSIQTSTSVNHQNLVNHRRPNSPRYKHLPFQHNHERQENCRCHNNHRRQRNYQRRCNKLVMYFPFKSNYQRQGYDEQQSFKNPNDNATIILYTTPNNLNAAINTVATNNFLNDPRFKATVNVKGNQSTFCDFENVVTGIPHYVRYR
jgi:hypothetical protein